jgi:hypothetical protein
MFFYRMERIDTSAVAHAILDAPGWARVGITAPSSCLREDAALELARVIADAGDRACRRDGRGADVASALRGKRARI